ncbi:MotA/TolQ/ExbB proton channel family protein [Celerinatantimonas diazotrophica]|uniref:Outer membrane transport energization protein ExbB n=1 Tax=Celerinatantimonas diazotrophica TaxID=412034 RepID=A0A4R1JMD3_9GAMM|nr:MotA/TolQ/ExbB proton channel family protein [Celerinatantimonas diazotrophica]TCK52187.1 outer membrane transport energization protein ExbB [Celerinatantimonas diazotrophica]CAG9296108.1 Tol-Pal system protein TolQ [Celerinatantimonas diazotrophica]
MKLPEPSLLIHFLQTGGWVLQALLGLCCILLILLLERYWFRWLEFTKLKQQTLFDIEQHSNNLAWLSAYCQLDLKLQSHLPLIRILIALCPLLGLLGTVTGMIQVFDGLALNQGANPQLMASGIAKATLPTMAGMAIAVFGLIFYTHLQRWSTHERIALSQQTGADEYL